MNGFFIFSLVLTRRCLCSPAACQSLLWTCAHLHVNLSRKNVSKAVVSQYTPWKSTAGQRRERCRNISRKGESRGTQLLPSCSHGHGEKWDWKLPNNPSQDKHSHVFMLIAFVKVTAYKMSALHAYVFDEFIFKSSKHGNICKSLVLHPRLLKSILD